MYYLLDQHVEVLWYFRRQTYHVGNLSVSHRPNRGRVALMYFDGFRSI